MTKQWREGCVRAAAAVAMVGLLTMRIVAEEGGDVGGGWGAAGDGGAVAQRVNVHVSHHGQPWANTRVWASVWNAATGSSAVGETTTDAGGLAHLDIMITAELQQMAPHEHMHARICAGTREHPMCVVGTAPAGQIGKGHVFALRLGH